MRNQITAIAWLLCASACGIGSDTGQTEQAGTAFTTQQVLGFEDAGRITVGQRADFITIDLDTWRTRDTGGSAETAVFAATAADVREVWHG